MKKNLGFIFLFGVMFLFLAGGHFALSRAQREVRRSIDRLGADIIVYPTGAEERDQPILASLFPTFMFLAPSTLEAVRSISGIEAATPISYVQSFDAICCQSEVRLIGYDPITNFVVPALVAQGDTKSSREKDLIVGFLVGRAGSDDPHEVVGAKIISLGEIFTIKAVMGQTRSNADVSAFIPMEQAERMIHALSKRYGWNRTPSSPSAILVRVKAGRSVNEVAEAISKKQDGLSPVIAPASVLSSKETLRKADTLLNIIGIVVGSSAGIALLGILFLAWKSRRSKKRPGEDARRSA
jgi:putative ABC transport system permease protein